MIYLRCSAVVPKILESPPLKICCSIETENQNFLQLMFSLHELKKMKNNFSLWWRCKKSSYFFAEIFMLLRCKLKKLFNYLNSFFIIKFFIIKSLVHAVATLNLNISKSIGLLVGVLYNGDFKSIVSRKTCLNLITCSKQHKKNSKLIFTLNQLYLSYTNILPVVLRFFSPLLCPLSLLISHSFDLGLSAFCAWFTLTINNFLRI